MSLRSLAPALLVAYVTGSRIEGDITATAGKMDVDVAKAPPTTLGFDKTPVSSLPECYCHGCESSNVCTEKITKYCGSAPPEDPLVFTNKVWRTGVDGYKRAAFWKAKGTESPYPECQDACEKHEFQEFCFERNGPMWCFTNAAPAEGKEMTSPELCKGGK
mmetsp:Transcript_10762/g.16130  ORF Transcript_10762/g.16130 Transcript_10762/m.16130 type:complete len:161 (-) Transcript_10762:73-555(-)